ncbi:hypothetical protein J5N97_020231 [Dioscorea zingiberensis]|uniref:Uncharacterized protein n=1 Tax=Dioscorea zingiberensis TaxID=325984 RepID=A0A9D5HDG4_9LILI|nr:hypothetical protein J5N97_020231 [Dioscorea zingiberensis]
MPVEQGHLSHKQPAPLALSFPGDHKSSVPSFKAKGKLGPTGVASAELSRLRGSILVTTPAYDSPSGRVLLIRFFPD